jgi:hypothetical protein
MKKLIIIGLILFSSLSFGQSLCKNDEYILLSGEIGKEDSKSNFIPNGKLISICSDRKKEPFLKVVYRFGKKDGIELEQDATNAKPFMISLDVDGFGRDRYQYTYKIEFNRGKYVYGINLTTGWMSASLGKILVQESNKKIAEISFNTIDENLESINFEKNKSQLFVIKK